MDRLKEAVIDVLGPEYARRVAAYGPASSQNWVSTTLKSVGGQVGALRSEYHRRVRSSGQGAADNWLTSRTRQIASSYVSPTTRTDGTTSSAGRHPRESFRIIFSVVCRRPPSRICKASIIAVFHLMAGRMRTGG